MARYLIRGATLVNEGQTYVADVLVGGTGRIERIGPSLSATAATVIDAQGQYLLPGVIDDQVHFREPGLTHKGTIGSESRAAVAGGTTTYLEMPNTKPAATTHALLEEKYARAAQTSAANYSFYLGATAHNLDEVLRTDPTRVCGIKAFLGSSTGDLLLDDEAAQARLFANCPHLIAIHAEHEPTLRANAEHLKAQYPDDLPPELHPILRSREACYRSSSHAVALAQRYGTRLHVLHISTAEEVQLFAPATTPAEVQAKRITAEACTHHLWFADDDYTRLGSRIQWNPAVKTAADRAALWQGIAEGRIDVLATDHAPHTLAEKQNPYWSCPSGGPLVQHSLLAGFAFVARGLALTHLVALMCHHPATLFGIVDRGFLREGYWADLVLVDPRQPTTVTPESLLYSCGWSPFEGVTFPASVTHTFVSGQLAYRLGVVDPAVRGMRLTFAR